MTLAMVQPENNKEKIAFLSRHRFVMMPAVFLDVLAKNKEYAWVFLVLWDESSTADPAQISVAKLVSRCKMNSHTIKDSLKWLQENGYVNKIETPGKPNEYKLSIEGAFANRAETPGSRRPQAPGDPRLPRAQGTNSKIGTVETVENLETSVIDGNSESGLTRGSNLPACCAGAGKTGSGKRFNGAESHQGSLSPLSPKVDGGSVGKECEETPRRGKSFYTWPIPKSLEKHKEKIFTFWEGKQGAKTLRSWKMQMTELEKLQVKYGDSSVDEQLSAAILAGNWHGIRLVNYERYGIDTKRKGNTQVNMNVHPSYRPLSYD